MLSVVILNYVMLSVVAALNIMLSAILMNYLKLSAVKLYVIMLSVVMLSVIILRDRAPQGHQTLSVFPSFTLQSIFSLSFPPRCVSQKLSRPPFLHLDDKLGCFSAQNSSALV